MATRQGYVARHASALRPDGLLRDLNDDFVPFLHHLRDWHRARDSGVFSASAVASGLASARSPAASTATAAGAWAASTIAPAARRVHGPLAWEPAPARHRHRPCGGDGAFDPAPGLAGVRDCRVVRRFRAVVPFGAGMIEFARAPLRAPSPPADDGD